MLAPLHWHDYKKKYGKLDDFVAAHTEVSSVDDFKRIYVYVDCLSSHENFNAFFSYL